MSDSKDQSAGSPEQPEEQKLRQDPGAAQAEPPQAEEPKAAEAKGVDPKETEPKAPVKPLKSLGVSLALPDHGKKPVLLQLLQGWDGQLVLVFVRSRYRANRLTALIRNQGVDALVLHGERNQKVRRKVAGRFGEDGAPILVTTESGLRGVDLTPPQQMVQFDLPHKTQTVAERLHQFPDTPMTTFHLERDAAFMESVAADAGVGFEALDLDKALPGFIMPPAPPPQEPKNPKSAAKAQGQGKAQEGQGRQKKKKQKQQKGKAKHNAYGIPGAYDPGDQRRVLRKYKDPKTEPLGPEESRAPFGRPARTQALVWRRSYDGPGLTVQEEESQPQEDVNGNIAPPEERRTLPPDDIGNKRPKNDRRQASVVPFGRPPERGNTSFRRTVNDSTLPQPSPLDPESRRDGYRTISPPAPASARRPVDRKDKKAGKGGSGKQGKKPGRMKRRFGKKNRR